jgi:hypothetical protein
MDFRVEFRGAILSVVPLSDCGLRRIERHVGADNGYQRYYPTFILELPCLGVIAGIARDGFMAETNLPSTSYTLGSLRTPRRVLKIGRAVRASEQARFGGTPPCAIGC